MKVLKPRMNLFFATLFSLMLIGISFAETRYVNGQAGNDTWDGRARTYETGTRGPKATINGAISISSMTGDVIEVNYANGLAYSLVDPEAITPNPNTHKAKEINFTSFGGTPTVNSWKITANTTFSGNFIIGTKLWLKKGMVYGGNYLTMQNNSDVERTLGEIATGQLQFLGTAKFTYDGGKPAGMPMRTGLEMPPSLSTGIVTDLNVLLAVAPATAGDSTVLELNENKQMNRTLTQNTGCNIHLGGYTLTIAQTAVNPHANNGDILDGEMVVNVGGDFTVTLPGDRILPNVTVNATGAGTRKLAVNTSKRIGVVTANGVSFIDLPSAGQTTLSGVIGGVVNNSTGTILIGGTGSANGRTVDPLGWVKAFNGLIFFDNPGAVELGYVELDGGTIKFRNTDRKVTINGDAKFVKGTWYMKGLVGTTPTPRILQLAGALYQFGMNGLNANFGTTRVGPVELLVKPISPVTAQTINGNKPGSIWHGTMKVANTTTAPSVTFHNGVFIVLGHVDFANGRLLVDYCTVTVGQDTTVGVPSSFTNAGGFNAVNGGYVEMKGGVAQNVQGTGPFGSFATNNITAPTGVTIAAPITCTEYFYLTSDTVSVSNNITFSNSVTLPKIVRLNGTFDVAPVFATLVNVEYQGNQKTTHWELPQGAQEGQLNDLLIKTQNNTLCANGYGWVRMNTNATVKGNLVIDPKQALIINDSRDLTLMGSLINLGGYLVTAQPTAWLVLANPNGTEIISDSYLPNIRIAPNSKNNKIKAKGLAVGIGGDMNALFCSGTPFESLLADADPGSIIFQKNVSPQLSSLDVQFTDTNRAHIDSLATHSYATLNLKSNLVQEGGLTHRTNAMINIGDYLYTIRGADIYLDGMARIVSSTIGRFIFNGTDQWVYLSKDGSTYPTIEANVEVNLTTSNLELVAGEDGADSLAVTKDFTLTKGTVWLSPYATETIGIAALTLNTNLTLLGKNFYLYQGGSVVGDGTLYLNATDAPMNWYIFKSPLINNLTIQKSVTILGENYDVTVATTYIHQDGTVNLGSNDLIIGGSFTRMAGTYEATTGYLMYNSDVSPFSHGNTNFQIPNFWIQSPSGVDISTAGSGAYTITKRLYLKNRDMKEFQHRGKMLVSDNVTVRYHSGAFNPSPTYLGKIRLIAVHGFDGKILPDNVWPEGSGIVKTFIVLTNDNEQDSTAAKNYTTVRLPVSNSVSDTLILRNGELSVMSGKSLTFVDGLAIIRVDGEIDPASTIISTGTQYRVTYRDNNPMDPGVEYDHAPAFLYSGLELPNKMHTLTFSRNTNTKNRFVQITKPIEVLGLNTLNIRNDVVVGENAKITVYGDVYIENESDVFPLATDPICTFWSPLCFAGDQDQTVYIPKDGIDLRPDPSLLCPQPPMAMIEINKTKPANIVTIVGGNLAVDYIKFINGLLNTEGDSYVEIPAPLPGCGQGFDRNGAVPGNTGYAIGRVMKRLQNYELDFMSSNERQEFPVGSLNAYRPMAYTFPPQSGWVTVPHKLGIIVQHIDKYPQGSKGFPLTDACGVTLQTYSNFYWFVQSDGTYSQEAYDLEVKAADLDGFADADQLRIVRRHGKPGEIDNTWAIQGDCNAYDNANYTDGPTIITERTKGGLRAEGAVFAVGKPEGQLPVVTHFEPIWSGNPYKAMTFYVTKAEFYAGKALQTGDEIAIFDGTTCVGISKVGQAASKTAPVIIVTSADDPATPAKDGFREGNSITYRIYDAKTGDTYLVNHVQYFKVDQDIVETNPVVFTGQNSTRVELYKTEKEIPGQFINLKKGWNIFSLAVQPSGSTNLFNTATPTVTGGGILNPIVPQLIKVVGTNDGTIEKLLSNWINTIGDWRPAEGYYINVNQDVTLHIPGTILPTPVTINLHDKWNIISYPCIQTEQNAINVLQPLIDAGVLKKAMDQYGHALEKLAFVGWYNGIGNMRPGEGYYIYVTAPTSFSITSPDQLAKSVTFAEAAAPKHFAREEANPYTPMNFYISSAQIDGQTLQVGDEVAVYDGKQMVGSAVVEREINENQPLALIAGMDDGSGVGFTKGNAVRFRVWQQSLNKEVDINLEGVSYKDAEAGVVSGSQAFEPRATAMISINAQVEIAAVPQAFNLQQNYPNPFNPSTTIMYAVPQESQVTVEIYDITGKLVTTLVDAKQVAGYHAVAWNGNNAVGSRVATGIYFYKMTAGNFSETRKMLFAK